jgi:excisionase family DNA binding protein
VDKILTVSEVASLLKISKAKIYLLAQKKKIPHIKIDKNIRIKESDLIAWLEKQTEPAKYF